MLSCVPVLYFVGVADYGAALMEQQAHHGKHTALDQYSKQPVPRYQVAACQAGQQVGIGMLMQIAAKNCFGFMLA